MLALRPLRGLVVIDEIQKRPDLFPTLRVLVDEPRVSRRFLVLGSASPELLQQTSETLAGRIAYHELDGFSVEEAGSATWERLWARGGFPRSFLARSFGVAHTTVQRHLDVLSETLMVRQLPSWHENVGKRQVKAPKVFVRDRGRLRPVGGRGPRAAGGEMSQVIEDALDGVGVSDEPDDAHGACAARADELVGGKVRRWGSPSADQRSAGSRHPWS